MRVAICVLRMLGVDLNPAEELIDIPPETAADFGGIVTFAMANWMNREPKDGPRADGRSSKLRPPRKLRPSSLTNSYLRGGRRQVPMSWGEVCDVERWLDSARSCWRCRCSCRRRHAPRSVSKSVKRKPLNMRRRRCRCTRSTAYSMGAG